MRLTYTNFLIVISITLIILSVAATYNRFFIQGDYETFYDDYETEENI